MAHEAKNPADELVLLRDLAQLEQHDKKVWRMLLEHLVAAKQWDEARKVGDSAVFVDVTGGPTHALYAEVLSQQGAHENAAFELETALLCPAKDKAERAQQHVLLAKEYLALGKKADATKHKDEALKLDDSNAEAKALKI
jgi:tetratricopeptide (TPR) repeat protein